MITTSRALRAVFVLVACILLGPALIGQVLRTRHVSERIRALELQRADLPIVELFARSGSADARALEGAVGGATVMDLRSAELTALLNSPVQHLALIVPTNDGDVELHLDRVALWTDGSSITLASTGGPAPDVQGLHYRGIVAGQPNTLVAISIFPDEVMGFVSDAQGDHVLGKLRGTSEHIYYLEQDLLQQLEFECATVDPDPEQLSALSGNASDARSTNCVRLYWEVNNDIYLDKGGAANTISFMLGLFNQHATLLENDGISVVLSELYLWDVESPYVQPGPAELLDQFGITRTSFNGDEAHLIHYGSAGIAYVNTLCSTNTASRMAVSGIYATFQGVPVYSWSVEVLTHELGHNLGSPHTHACAWNGNNTAIDGCASVQGTCAQLPYPPVGSGTIMSYCHLVGSVGINFSNGFGPQPQALILGYVNNATCLVACGTAACGIPSNVIAGNVLDVSAMISWAAVPGAIGYELQWRALPAGTWSQVWCPGTTYSMIGLVASTSYEFKVRTLCLGGGTTAFSATGQFTTLVCVPGGPCDDGDIGTIYDVHDADCTCVGEPGPWMSIEKIVSGDRNEGDEFGYSVDVDGDHAIIGARYDADPITAAGAAYIFQRIGNEWVQQQKLVASDRAFGDMFGVSVAIHGNYAVVGAGQEDQDAAGQNTLDGAGSAYIFVRNGTTWTQQQKIVAGHRITFGGFGYEVDIHGDHVIAGSYGDAVDVNGANPLTVAGAAYVFVRNGTTWTQQQKLVASDRATADYFGTHVAIESDQVVVGAYGDDQQRGSAYVFTLVGGTWTQQQKLVASDRALGDHFGINVDLSGDRIIVGAASEDNDATTGATATDAGAVYMYFRNAGVWSQQQKITPGDRAASDFFGRSVAIRGTRALVGAYGNDLFLAGVGDLNECGSAYVYAWNGTTWVQEAMSLAGDRAADDRFGWDVALSDEHLFIGSYQEDENLFGMNTMASAGSAYFASPPQRVVIALKVFLKGPYNSATGLMSDALRSHDLLPLSGPYANMGYVHVGGGGELATASVLAQTGNDAIVDWVVVELRSSADPTVRLATRNALVQRDGDIVSSDGVEPVSFAVSNGTYYVAIRHRNHLGVMTAAPIALSSATTTVDFINPATLAYGPSALDNVSGAMVLWPGDTNFDGIVRYLGVNNDRDAILTAIGGGVPTNVVNNVYSLSDVNMDGTVKYIGVNNDRDPILQTVGGSVPTATRVQQLP